jgi:hypothetical protein
MKLLELPSDAFEIYKNPDNGKDSIRIKPSFMSEQEKKNKSDIRSIYLLT